MPDLSANLADFRLGGHTLRANLSFYVGRLVYDTTLAGISPYPVRVLIVNTAEPTYDHADIKPGFRVDIYTSDGRFKGRTRVRFGNMITDTAIHIRETSDAAIHFVVGDIVRVYNDLRLSDKLVEANEWFLPDGTAFTDQGLHPPPLPASGGAYAGRSAWTFPMTGSPSALLDPASATPPTHLWNTDGLVLEGASVDTDADLLLSGTEGEYLVAHTVTDPDNGNDITQYVPVVIDDHPYKVIVEDLPNDEQRGGSARVRMLQNATLDAVPDGALAILWKDEYISGVRQSFGKRSPGRSHILFVGYLRREEGEFDAEDGVESLTFELISPLARLEELMGYGKVMIRAASPDGWSEVADLTVKRGIVQIPLFYSTLLESGFDFIFTDTYVDYDYSGFFLDQSNPLAQMRELAKGVDARIVEDRSGRFEAQLIPERAAIADRDDWTVMLALTKRDVKRWHYTREHWVSLNRLECRGFIAGASTDDNVPIFSEWFGTAPGEGNQQQIEEKLIAVDQNDLNARAGRIGAALAGLYTDADGAQQMALDLELTLRGVYDVFDFYDELIELNWSTVKRGIDLSTQQYRLVGTTVDFHDGTADTTLRLRTCTNGLPGTTYVPPAPDSTNLPPIDTPSPPPISPAPFFGIGRGSNTMYAVNTDGYLYGTANFQRPALQGGALWSREDLGLADDVIDAVQDAFAPSKLIVVTVGATDAIYTVEGVGSGGALTITARKTLRAAISNQTLQWRMVDASFGADYVVVVSYYGNSGADSGTWYTYSTNGGVSWSTETQITAFYSTTPGGAQFPGLFVSSRLPGVAYIGAYTASGLQAAAESDIYRLSGTFASPTAQSAGANDILPRCIHRSWADNENTMYWTVGNFAESVANRSHIYRKVGSAAREDITPTIGGNHQGLFLTRGLHTCPVDANTVLAAVAGNTTSGVVMSRNKGTAWTQISAGTTTDYASAEVAGNDRNVGYVWGNSGAIGYVDLATGTIDDRRGNIPVDYPSIGRFVRIFSL